MHKMIADIVKILISSDKSLVKAVHNVLRNINNTKNGEKKWKT